MELNGYTSAILRCKPACCAGHLMGVGLRSWPRGPESFGKSFWFQRRRKHRRAHARGAHRSRSYMVARRILTVLRTNAVPLVWRFRGSGHPQAGFENQGDFYCARFRRTVQPSLVTGRPQSRCHAFGLKQTDAFSTLRQKWSELTRGGFGFPNWSHDGKYVYVVDISPRF